VKTTIKTLGIIIIVGFITSSFSQETAVKYYRHVDNEGTEPLIGKHKIDAEIALDVNCYRFVFNAQDQLIAVEYLKKGKIRKDPFYGVARFMFEYEEGAEFRFYQDVEGNCISDTTGVFKHKRILDKENNTVLTINFDNEGNIIEDVFGASQNLAILNQKGLPIKHCFLDKVGKTIANKHGIFSVGYKYDQSDNVIEICNYNKDQQLSEDKTMGAAICRSKFDEYGNMIEAKFYDNNGDIKNTIRGKYAIIRSKYDEMGNRVEISLFASDEKLLNNMKFDGNGNIIFEE